MFSYFKHIPKSLSDTTDIQSVEILELVYLDSVRISCRFMTGSDARGCMVILMGELSNATMSLTRKDDSVVAVAIHTLPHSLTCYHQVVAFDIESNGKVGTVTVPGILHRQVDQREKCNLPTKETPLQGELIVYTKCLFNYRVNFM